MNPMSSRSHGGFALTEVLITIVLVAFGLLGLAGLVSRSFVAEVEATQRTQALMLLHDMASRIEANRREVADYVTGDAALGYSNGEQVCAGLATTPERDRCEWNNLLVGVGDRIDAQNAGVLPRAVGCIHEIDAFNRIYSITIAWQGVNEGLAPSADLNFMPAGCGRDFYGLETHRRLITLPVRLAVLT
jgi:type IV pilus assembly protein PilV